ncbi:MAG: hypothetical protein JWL73_3291 [Actinomycetia bacterium]|nr:hypothetical protein [Actinomycetes bacterium]
MALVVGVLLVGVILVIAAFFLAREAGRLAQEPPAPVFDMTEAYDWVVEHLPDDIAATLTPKDVRRILKLQMDFFKRKGVAVNGSTANPPGPVIVGGAETVDYVIEQGAVEGYEFHPEQVHAVIETQLRYMRAIGAISNPAKPRLTRRDLAADPRPELPPEEPPPELPPG